MPLDPDQPASPGVNPTQSVPAYPVAIDRLQSLSYWLDNAIPIPGTGYRIGLDPILGLLPGGGDTFTGLLSAYIVWESARLGLPRPLLLRMAWNIVLEVVLGSVPIAGDVFDATWKANAKNVHLLRQHFRTPQTSRRANLGFAILLVIGLVGVILGFVAFSLWLLAVLIQAIAGG